MIAVERSGIELDHCISCRGLWFDRGELDLLAELTGADLASIELTAGAGAGARRNRVCPRCDEALEEIVIGGLRIDRCPKGDGLWFDRGELGSLLDRGLETAEPLQQVSSFLGEVFGVRSVRVPEEIEEDAAP